MKLSKSIFVVIFALCVHGVWSQTSKELTDVKSAEDSEVGESTEQSEVTFEYDDYYDPSELWESDEIVETQENDDDETINEPYIPEINLEDSDEVDLSKGSFEDDGNQKHYDSEEWADEIDDSDWMNEDNYELDLSSEEVVPEQADNDADSDKNSDWSYGKYLKEQEEQFEKKATVNIGPHWFFIIGLAGSALLAMIVLVAALHLRRLSKKQTRPYYTLKEEAEA